MCAQNCQWRKARVRWMKFLSASPRNTICWPQIHFCLVRASAGTPQKCTWNWSSYRDTITRAREKGSSRKFMTQSWQGSVSILNLIWYDQQTNIFQFTFCLWLSETLFVNFIHLVASLLGHEVLLTPCCTKKRYFRWGMACKLDEEIAIASFHHVLNCQLLKTWNSEGLCNIYLSLAWSQ